MALLALPRERLRGRPPRLHASRRPARLLHGEHGTCRRRLTVWARSGHSSLRALTARLTQKARKCGPFLWSGRRANLNSGPLVPQTARALWRPMSRRGVKWLVCRHFASSNDSIRLGCGSAVRDVWAMFGPRKPSPVREPGTGSTTHTASNIPTSSVDSSMRRMRNGWPPRGMNVSPSRHCGVAVTKATGSAGSPSSR